MKDQNTISDSETQKEKWDRAKSLMLESLYKPDTQLRACGHNQLCYNELMSIRDQVIEDVMNMSNPHTPPLEFGKKNNHIEPTISTPKGEISETLMSGALGDYYADKREY